ncbi:MAG: hypothetical protein EPN89_03280 [Methylovulum sp.]|nr:MAG: hypothetical protein EPN89_03280 [Methylovulum sp.]
MPNRAELETQLVNQIHSLPLEAIETMLKLVMLMKKNNMTEASQQANNFVDFIRNSPLMDVDIDLTRDQSLCRDIEL